MVRIACMTSTDIQTVCQSFFSVKKLFHEEKNLVQLNCLPAFPPDNHHTLGCATQGLCMYFGFCHTEYF